MTAILNGTGLKGTTFPLIIEAAMERLTGILNSIAGLGSFHVDPRLLELAALVQIYSSIHDDPSGERGIDKILAYSGLCVFSPMGTLVDAADLAGRVDKDEGEFGLESSVFAQLFEACVRQRVSTGGGASCVTAWDFLVKLREFLNREGEARLLGFVEGDLAQWRIEQRRRDVIRALKPNFELKCQDVFERYIAELAAGVCAPETHMYAPFVAEVERLHQRAPRGKFRQQMLMNFARLRMEQPEGRIPYTALVAVREGIEYHADREGVRLQLLDGDRSGFHTISTRLSLHHGYCPHCAFSLHLERYLEGEQYRRECRRSPSPV